MDPENIRLSRTFTSSILALIFSFIFAVQVFAFSVEVSNAPDNDLALILKAIHGARKSILVNIYEFTSKDIAEALLERVNAGVHVEILQEGDPVGGLSEAAREIQIQLSQEMVRSRGSNHYYEMTKKAGGKRRFRWNHAKYIVIDGSSLVVGSENYSPSGNPVEGKLGNRGWEVLIHEKELSRTFSSLFRKDSDPSNGDVLDLVSDTFTFQAFELWDVFEKMSRMQWVAAEDAHVNARRPSPELLEASDAVSISSPDTSLSGLEALLNSATTRIDLELMTMDSNWGGVGKESPLFAAVVDAARRGVQVRVLLNDERAFIHAERNFVSKNQNTVKLLKSLGGRERLNIDAKIANLKAMNVTYIHNKGALVDGDKTLISSINWNENSVERNREAAVILVSEDIHAYYLNLFEKDWAASAGK